MLKAVCCLSYAFRSEYKSDSRVLFKRQILSAYISTNTAINKSLRRSQYNIKRPERQHTDLLRRSPAQDPRPGRRRPQDQDRSFGRRINNVGAPRERILRPNHEQGIDVEDIKESARINNAQRPQRRLRKSLRRNEKGEFDRSTRGAKYDYDINPEGNRVLRRAVKFGHQSEPGLLGHSKSAIHRAAHRKAFHGNKNYNSEKDIFDHAPPDHTLRRAATVKHRGEQERGLSMPEEFQENLDPSSEHDMPRFSIRRHLDRPDRSSYMDRPRENGYEARARASGDAFKGRPKDSSRYDDERSPSRDTNVPLSMPYTTPASEFLYGTSVIMAALLSSRRKLYKLYIYAGDNREALQQDNRIRELALERGVVVERVKEDYLGLMYKMSDRRPHNGYILEASPLPKLPITGFQSVEKRSAAFHVILDHQSREDAAVNGTSTKIEYEVSFPRYPFVLLLDGILDPGNLGAILRSAFFLGVDTVAISNRNSAPVSPVAIKASAGASEALPLVSVSQPGNFIDRCKGNGWKIYAAAAPTPGKRTGLDNYLSTSTLGNPVRAQPCMLILGGEGEGLHWNIRRKADFDVGIDGPRSGQVNVDSLNVSVAAGLLCEAFLRKPSKGKLIDANAPFDVEEWTTSPSQGAKIQREKNRVF